MFPTKVPLGKHTKIQLSRVTIKKMKNPPAYDCSLGFCAINEPILIIATFMC